jgi:hypothetical protein
MTVSDKTIGERITDPELLAIRLDDIDKSVRLTIYLEKIGIETIGQLARLTEAEIQTDPNPTYVILKEIWDLLNGVQASRVPQFPGQSDSEEGGIKAIRELFDKDEIDFEELPIPGGPFELLEEELTSAVKAAAHPNDWNVLSLDFLTISDTQRHLLLKPLSELGLSVRSENCMRNARARVLGEIARMDHSKLLRLRNLGRKSLKELEAVLNRSGLTFGAKIANWPMPAEIDSYLEKRKEMHLGTAPIPGGPFELLEEELTSAVKAAAHPNDWNVLLRRMGWDGGEQYTLEEIGIATEISGLKSKVSRERIRQLEQRSLKSVRHANFEMPVLDRALALIAENAPIAIERLPLLLTEASLTRVSFGYNQLFSAMTAFGKHWDLVLIGPLNHQSLIPQDIAEHFTSVRELLFQNTRTRDFLSIKEIEGDLPIGLDDPATLIEKVIQADPKLEWLDRDSGVVWSRGRQGVDWNKSLNVCVKVLTVTNEVSLKQLLQSVEKARTVAEAPTQEILRSMLTRDDKFKVDGEIVKPTSFFKKSELSGTDELIIKAAKDLGPVVNFTNMREFLVRQGMSSNQAQVSLYASPFLTPISRGQYRFVCNPEEASRVLGSLREGEKHAGGNEIERILVEIVVTQRQLISGKHELSENRIGPGDWAVFDPDGRALGELRTNETQILDLDVVLLAASVKVGDRILLEFDKPEKTATLIRSK